MKHCQTGTVYIKLDHKCGEDSIGFYRIRHNQTGCYFDRLEQTCWIRVSYMVGVGIMDSIAKQTLGFLKDTIEIISESDLPNQKHTDQKHTDNKNVIKLSDRKPREE